MKKEVDIKAVKGKYCLVLDVRDTLKQAIDDAWECDGHLHELPNNRWEICITDKW